MPEGKSREEPQPQQPLRGRRGVIRVFLMIFVILLGALAIWSASSNSAWDELSWKPNTSNWILQTAGQLGVFALRDFVLFVPLAFLCAAACSRSDRNYGWISVPFALVLGFAGSVTIALLLKAVMMGFPLRPPSILAITFVAILCLWGSWAGATWSRTQNMWRWFFRQLPSIAVCVAVVGLLLAWFGLDTQPLDIASTPIDTEDRRRLVKVVRKHDPRDLEPDETSQLTLTEQDFNQLLTWGFSMLPGEQEAVMEIDADRVSLAFSYELPPIPVFNNVLNIRTAGKPITQDGELGFAPLRLKIGRIDVPAWLLKFSGPIMVDKNWHNEGTRPFFSSLKEVVVDDGEITVAYGHLELPDGFVRDALVGIGAMEDVAPAARAHVENLLQLARENQQLTFGQCMETAFTEAKRRSANGDPVHENRAAILAMGYLLGHRCIKKFVGPEMPDVSPELTKKFRRITLRGRGDWTRHYTLSAALEVLSNALASNAVGLLKEELDADGGSGFSFADLLADRAGTMLAVSATRSKGAAEAMQDRLASGFVVDDIMPAGTDLSEGLHDQEFQRQFGGVGGARYNQVLADIDRRIGNCAAYQERE